MSKKKRNKYLRANIFHKNNKKHFIRMQKTGNEMPQPARIIISYDFWCHVGGVRGWESKTIYDKVFEDWKYAHAIYDEILKRSDLCDESSE